jgi:hypothetical protein
MNKYLVVSYDSNEQQWFYDIVFADTEDAAKERITTLRPYVIDTDAFDVAAMSRLHNAFQNETKEGSEKWMKELEEESAVEDK